MQRTIQTVFVSIAATVLLLVCVMPIEPSFARERALELEMMHTESRIALVIGNADYDIKPLKNPINDARLMAVTLEGLGFEVIRIENASRKEMLMAIDDFGQKIRGGGVGMFYYAGHGVQVNGTNYLIPVRASIKTETDVTYEAIDAGKVLGKMEDAGTRVNIVMLDACRDNPFITSGKRSSANRGLAEIKAPMGSYIAYATAAGGVADDGDGINGIFTEQFVKAIGTEGLEIESVFREVRAGVMDRTGGTQMPWTASSMTGQFYFRVPKESAEQMTPDKDSASSVEEQLWSEIENSTNPMDFAIYLDTYPEGKYAGLARYRMQRLPGASTQGGQRKTQMASYEPQPKNSIGVYFKNPAGARLVIGARSYDINTSPIVFFKQGRTSFQIENVGGKSLIYGLMEVLYIDDQVEATSFGTETDLFKQSQIDGALQGRPVFYTVKMQTSSGPQVIFKYTLSLRELR